MDITIKGIKITLRYSIRAMLMYEGVQEKLSGGDLVKSIYLLWAIIFASLERTGDTDKVNYADFFDYIDEEPGRLYTLTDWLKTEMEKQATLRDERLGSEGDGDGKKK